MKQMYLFGWSRVTGHIPSNLAAQMLKRATICCIAATMMVGAYSAAFASETQWSAVAEALGKSGTEMAGGVYRVGMPRTCR
jgi:hypothetical protein